MLDLIAQTTTTLTSSNITTNGDVNGGIAAGVIIAVIIGVIFGILGIVATWKIFDKAGEKGWKAIIPVYNMWTLFEISGKPGWWALLILITWIPIVGLIASALYFVLFIIAMLELARRFGKSPVFAIFGLIIFSIIGLLILGFGDAKYSGTKKKTDLGSVAPAA